MDNNKLANELLKEIYGEKAQFKTDQFEAIDSVLNNKRTIVVQKTGWGKSLVYFLSTKMNRLNSNGLTVVVSPLLVLMENQIDAARKMNLKCCTINSRTDKFYIDEFFENTNEYDMLFITPESLFNPKYNDKILALNIGMFVIDECHCISDWGHDFRLEYGKLNKIINALPSSIPVLGTTATANDRVLDDLVDIFGYDCNVIRGELTRESLNIQVLNMKSLEERYLWMLKNIPLFDGSGIVFCLTKRDCINVANFLNDHGINAEPYFSSDDMEEQNKISEDKFMNNEIKVLVATIKLGMGYDKPDISFIIHYQQPSHLVSYYQQIGRAGRALDEAYCYMMTGKEDLDILNYFINIAFPPEKELQKIIDLLDSHDGLSINELSFNMNSKQYKIRNNLSFLINEDFVYKEGSKFYRSTKKYVYNREYYEQRINIKKKELQETIDYISTEECLSEYVITKLNDKHAKKCGKCSNCRGTNIFPTIDTFELEEINLVQEYINRLKIDIEPRKVWPTKSLIGEYRIAHKLEYGYALSIYGNPGYGAMVKDDKYGAQYYRDELKMQAVKIIRELGAHFKFDAIIPVPSNSNDKVHQLASRIAKEMNIEYIDAFEKKKCLPQKNMENSYYQAKNVLDSVKIKDGIKVPKNILLIDDIVDSKWTLTVCGYLLGEKAEYVVPFALADSSGKDNESE